MEQQGQEGSPQGAMSNPPFSQPQGSVTDPPFSQPPGSVIDPPFSQAQGTVSNPMFSQPQAAPFDPSFSQTQYNPGSYGTPPGMPYRGSESSNIDLVGILWIIYGALSLVGGIAVGLIWGGMGLAIGASSSKPDDIAAGGAFMIFAVVFAVICGLGGLPSIAAGIGIRRRASWGRIMGIIMAVLNALSLPLGTGLAIFTFVVLSKPEAVAEFN